MLGTTELTTPDGGSADGILAQPKRLALLAWLCVARPAGYRRREQLLALFWPELDERRARSALSQALHKIRLALGPDSLLTRGADEVGVNLDTITCDVLELRQALADERLEHALALYQGDMLDGLHVSHCADFDHWLDQERNALRERVATAAWGAVSRARAAGDTAAALRIAQRALAVAPSHEPGVRQCMELLAESGDYAGAIQCFDQFAERMRRDLGAAPSPGTAALAARLQEASPRALPHPGAHPVSTPRTAERTTPMVGAVDAHGHPPGPRWRWVVAAAGLAAVVMWTFPRARPATVKRATDFPAHRVLVLPFVVRGDSSLDFLAHGMVDLLSTSIDGLADMQAVDPFAALAAGSPGTATDGATNASVALARRLGADAFLRGEVLAIAGRLEVRGLLYDGEGRRIASLASGVPSLARLPEAVDDLARQLAANRLAGPSHRLSRLATATTDSLEALRAYLDGEQHLRLGRHAPAADAFRRAVRIDSLFALAWFRLGVALEWVQSSGTERRTALERAAAQGDRLTERDRVLLRAQYTYSYGSLLEAEALYRQLVTQYPEDLEAWYGLAEVIFHAGPFQGRPMARSEAAFRRVLALYPQHLEARLHLARILAARQDGASTAELDSLVAGTLPLLVADVGQGYRLRAVHAFARGDTATMRTVTAQAATLPELDIWETAALIASTTGNLGGATEVVRHLTVSWRAPHWRAIGHMALASLALAEGRWTETQHQLTLVSQSDSALGVYVLAFMSGAPWMPLADSERNGVRRRLEAIERRTATPVVARIYPSFPVLADPIRRLDLVLLALATRDTVAAIQYVDAFRAAQAESPVPADWGLEASARAALEVSRGQPARALDALEGAHAVQTLGAYPRTFIVSNALERWIRAGALHASGRPGDALDWYGSLTCYLCLMDTPWEAPAWLREGQIHEELGERAAAHRAYRRVLHRWRGADPMFASLLAEARAGATRTVDEARAAVRKSSSMSDAPVAH